MTCTSCGDKPKGSSKGFPRAVVEINNPESLVLLRKVVIPASMGTEEDVPPAIGKYFNVLLQYEANGHIYLYSSDGIPTAIEANIPQEALDRIDQLEIDVDLLETGLAKETEDREKADGVLQQEIDDIKNSPDVVDIVATYSDLMAYDTSSLGNNDVIRVLRDETHDGQSAYYRWDKPHSTWTFVGTVGDYYTKQQVDALLDGKQDELTPGENISIIDESGDLVISAQDTTYTAGYGLSLEGTEFSVDPDIIQDTLTAGDNITIEDESGSLVISAADSLSPTTTFWGQTANNGVVDGQLTITNNGGLPTMKVGGGFIDTGSSTPFYIRALKSGSTYSNVFWWNSASNHVPSDVHIDAANAHLVLKDNGVLNLRNDANGPLTISGVKDPQSANDAANKQYVDSSIPTVPTITMTNVDPGEGSALAANNFIGVYE